MFPVKVRLSLIAHEELLTGYREVEDSVVVTLVPGKDYVTIAKSDLPKIDFATMKIASINVVSATDAPIRVRLEVASYVKPKFTQMTASLQIGQSTTINGRLTGFDPVQHRLSLYDISTGVRVLKNTDLTVNTDGTFSSVQEYVGGIRRFEAVVEDRIFGSMINNFSVSFSELLVSGTINPLPISQESRVNALLAGESQYLNINHISGSKNVAADAVSVPGYSSGFSFKTALRRIKRKSDWLLHCFLF